MTRIGVFGSPEDDQVAAVVAAAEVRGAEVTIVRLTPEELARFSWSLDSLETGDGIRLDSLRSIYVRSIPTPQPRHGTPVVGKAEESAWVDRVEAGRRMHSTARAVQVSLADRGVEMVNPLDCFWFHRSKPAADQRLAAAGLPVPLGIVTADVGEVRGFAREVGEVVYKPVAGGGACRALDADDLTGVRAASLSRSPVLFQERIRGRDLRIYVIDGRVVGACVIHTEAVDYRGHETGLDRIEPSDEVASLAARAASVLGMVFAGIDIKEAEDGRLTVLDVNPSPMFASISEATGIRVPDALAAHLIGGGDR